MHNVLIRRVLAVVLLTPLLSVLGFMYALRAGGANSRKGAIPGWAELQSAYGDYLTGIMAGDWGAIWRQVPLWRFLSNSLQLLGVALVVMIILGPLLGILAVNWRQRRMRPVAVSVFAVINALPGFFVTTLVVLVIIYVRRLGIVTTERGYIIPVQGTGFDAHIILPVLTLVLRPLTTLAALTATSLEHELHQEYVLAAQGRGLSWLRIVLRHALPNIRSNVLVMMGQGTQAMVSALLLVEPLLDWRGAGWLLTQVFIAPPNYGSPYLFNPYVLALLLPLFGAVILLLDGLAQVLSRYLDPRLRQPGLLEGALQ